MNYFTILFTLLCIFSLCSCSTTSVEYVGDSYSTTSTVDVYYDANTVIQDYHIMGQAIGSQGEYDKIVDKLKISAMEKGADAILIAELDRVGGSGESGPCNQIKASFLKYQ